MIALLSFLTIIVISIAVIRIGTTALELTGLSKDVASFQALSAFTGSGFTSSETETVMSNPVRRKIARILMLLGSAGITSLVATFLLTFLVQSELTLFARAVLLLLGIVIILILINSELIEKWMRILIKNLLEKYTSLDIYDYQEILGLSDDHTICRINVKDNNWMAFRKLRELDLTKEGVLVLSIQRTIDGKQKISGAPGPDTEIRPDDTLICYGRSSASKKLSKRIKGTSGDHEHEEEVEKEKNIDNIRKEYGEYL